MKTGDLRDVTGKFARESVEWIREDQSNGCCSICFATDDRYNYAVCIGWHYTGSDWVVAWKIGRQTTNNIMQSDLDIDFEMPYSAESGDVDDTLETIEVANGKPVGYRSWDDLASRMRVEASRVWNSWKEVSDDGS